MGQRRQQQQDQHQRAAQDRNAPAAGAAVDDAEGSARTGRRTDAPAPRRPDERDLSVDTQAGPPRPVIERAHDDLAEGQIDTDARSRGAGELMRRLRDDDAENNAENTHPERTEDGK